MNIRERLGKELLFLDGGMGTLLQAEGLAPGELPETWNIEHPEKVEAIHRRYYEAGSDVVLANTFGANVCKFHDDRDCKCKKSRGADWKRDLCGTGYGTDRKAIKTNGRSGF